MPFPMTKGSEVTVQYQSVSVPGHAIRLLQTVNKTTGEVLQKHPRCIVDGTAALIVIETLRPICIELFSSNKQLGRITLRDRGRTLATGIVTQLLKRVTLTQ
jgi:elongation factor 1 alpha-like protein